MIWNNHSYLKDKHSFLSPSNYSWLNYDEDKLTERYLNHLAVQRGTALHKLAEDHINLHISMPRTKKTLDRYVNDAIGYGMDAEIPLEYSKNAFGTTDAILFKKDFLRIHDLKTGVTPASIKQLYIYAALFCLEYKVKPGEINMELRIYQNDDIMFANPTAEDILPIMDKIKTFDKIIEELKMKGD